MFTRLHSLKNKGYNPDMILDIGAHKGWWTRDCLNVFPTSEYLLFEAIPYSELNFMKHKVYNVLLNDTETEVDWFEERNTGDSMFCEKSKHFKHCVPTKRQTTTLDSVLRDRTLPAEIFIKIDCQGAEIPILKGATNALKNASVILLEIPFFGQYNTTVPSFLDHISFMDSIGYVVYDTCEHHYINDFLMQVDVIFIRKDHVLNNTVQHLLL
jgi:FkbM family methyltransferase